MMYYFKAKNASEKVEHYVLDFCDSKETGLLNYEESSILRDKVKSLDLMLISEGLPNRNFLDYSERYVKDVWMDFLKEHFIRQEHIIFSAISEGGGLSEARLRLFGSWVKSYQQKYPEDDLMYESFTVPYDLYGETFFERFFFIFSGLNSDYSNLIASIKTIVQ